MKKIEELEARIKEFIHAVLENPLVEESVEEKEEILLPPSLMEQYEYPYDIFEWNYLDYEDDYEDAYAYDNFNYFDGTESDLPFLVDPEKPDKYALEETSGLSADASWVPALKDARFDNLLNPEQIESSPLRLSFLASADLKPELIKLNSLVGEKTVQSLFHKDPYRFINLLEMAVVYKLFDDRFTKTAMQALGPLNTRRIIARWMEFFQQGMKLYLEPLCNEPSLPALVDYLGPSFLAAYRRTVSKSIVTGDNRKVRKFLYRLVYKMEFLKRLGSEAKKLSGLLGKDFFRKYLTKKKGLEAAVHLVQLGIPLWEDILTHHVGMTAFKEMAIRDPEGLTKQLNTFYRTPRSSLVIQLLGRQRVETLLRGDPDASLQLSVIGIMICLRHYEFDNVEHLKKFRDGGILKIIRLGLQFPLVNETLDIVAHSEPPGFVVEMVEPLAVGPLLKDAGAPEPQRWKESLLHCITIVRRFHEEGFFHQRELLLFALGRPDESLDEIIKTYNRIRDTFRDTEHYTAEQLYTASKQNALVVPIACSAVEKLSGRNIHIFEPIVRAAFKLIDGNNRTAPIPEFARAIRLEIKEALFQPVKTFDSAAIHKIQEDLRLLDNQQALFKEWLDAFKVCTMHGFRFAPDVERQFQSDIAADSMQKISYNGFRILSKCLLIRYNHDIADLTARLFSGHILQANPRLKDYIFGADETAAVSALYELFFDRLEDVPGKIVSAFRDSLQEWLSGQKTEHAGMLCEKLQQLKSISEIKVFIENTEGLRDKKARKLATRMKKSFPLFNDLFIKYRTIALRECARIKPVMSDNIKRLILRPSNSFINLFSGIYGEDCSTESRLAARLFQPGHVFYQILFEGSDVLRGYISILLLKRGNESALKFDVINPSNNVTIAPEDFLQQLVESLGKQAQEAGIDFIGFSDAWQHISNRNSLNQAAQKLYSHCPIEEGFALEQTLPGIPANRIFQSIQRPTRIIWKNPSRSSGV